MVDNLEGKESKMFWRKEQHYPEDKAKLYFAFSFWCKQEYIHDTQALMQVLESL